MGCLLLDLCPSLYHLPQLGAKRKKPSKISFEYMSHNPVTVCQRSGFTMTCLGGCIRWLSYYLALYPMLDTRDSILSLLCFNYNYLTISPWQCEGLSSILSPYVMLFEPYPIAVLLWAIQCACLCVGAVPYYRTV